MTKYLRINIILISFAFLFPEFACCYDKICKEFDCELAFIHDSENSIDKDSVLNATFTPIIKLPFNNGFKNGFYWIKIEVNNSSEESQNKIFEIREPYINIANVYVPKNTSLHQLYELGNKVELKYKPIKNRNLAFPICLKPGINQVYLQVNYHRNTSFLFFIKNPQEYFLNEQKAIAGFSFYYGGVIIILLVNLFFFFSFKDKAFLFYSITLASMAFGFLCLDGLLVFILPPGWLLSNIDVVSYIVLTIFGGRYFASEYLHTNKYVKHANIIESTITIVACVIFILCIIAESALLFALGLLAMIVLALYYLTVSFISLKDNLYARFFAFAYSFLFFLVLLYAVPIVFGNDILQSGSWILKIGSFIDMIVISYAIVYKMKVLNEENKKMSDSIKQYMNEIKEIKIKDIHTNRSILESDQDKLFKIKHTYSLTEREVDVLKSLMQNKTNAEIADSLYVSVNTIKYHVKNIYRKLNTNDRLQVQEEIQKVLN